MRKFRSFDNGTGKRVLNQLKYSELQSSLEWTIEVATMVLAVLKSR